MVAASVTILVIFLIHNDIEFFFALVTTFVIQRVKFILFIFPYVSTVKPSQFICTFIQPVWDAIKDALIILEPVKRQLNRVVDGRVTFVEYVVVLDEHLHEENIMWRWHSLVGRWRRGTISYFILRLM